MLLGLVALSLPPSFSPALSFAGRRINQMQTSLVEERYQGWRLAKGTAESHGKMLLNAEN